jgi:hypothetical protein
VVTGASSRIGRRIAVDKRSRCERPTTEEHQPRIPSPALGARRAIGCITGTSCFPGGPLGQVARPTGSFASGFALR